MTEEAALSCLNLLRFLLLALPLPLPLPLALPLPLLSTVGPPFQEPLKTTSLFSVLPRLLRVVVEVVLQGGGEDPVGPGIM